MSMTDNERRLLLILAWFAMPRAPTTAAKEIERLSGAILTDLGMEPPKAPPIPAFAFDGPALRNVAARYGVDYRPKESDADLRVRVLDAIARSARAPEGAPTGLRAWAVRYDETQTFEVTAFAEEAREKEPAP